MTLSQMPPMSLGFEHRYDGIGVVLFLEVLAASKGEVPSIDYIGALLLLKSGGGLLLGIALAWLASELMRRVEACQIEILLTLFLVLGGYALQRVCISQLR